MRHVGSNKMRKIGIFHFIDELYQVYVEAIAANKMALLMQILCVLEELGVIEDSGWPKNIDNSKKMVEYS